MPSGDCDGKGEKEEGPHQRRLWFLPGRMRGDAGVFGRSMCFTLVLSNYSWEGGTP